MNVFIFLYDIVCLSELVQLLIDNVCELVYVGWILVISSNFFYCLDDCYVVIIVLGKDKGCLIEDDIMVVDFDGQVVGCLLCLFVEILLYIQLYCCFLDVGCVLYMYLLVQIIVLCLYVLQGYICLEGYELLKVFVGNSIYEMVIEVLVFVNIQDMNVLLKQVDDLFDWQNLWGYLIDGYGLYVWGCDMVEVCCYLEVFEFLFYCELELCRLCG